MIIARSCAGSYNIPQEFILDPEIIVGSCVRSSRISYVFMYDPK